MSLPKPVFSEGDLALDPDRSYLSASRIWESWSQDPIKLAILQAVLPYQSNLSLRNTSEALSQNSVCFLPSCSLEVVKVYY